jgi:predicted DsbA family dithiol-disulfide isomerase
MISEILNRNHPVDLSEEMRKVERGARAIFADRLRQDPRLLLEIAKRAGVDAQIVKRQLADLRRDRSRRNDEA